MARRFMKPGDVIEMAHAYFPSFLASRHAAQVADSWQNGRQYDLTDLDIDDPAYGRPFTPRGETIDAEYENLRGLSPNNFAGLVVTTIAQTAFVEGIHRPGSSTTLPAWITWQRNRWDAKQIPIHRTAIGTGVAYGVVLPGIDPLTGAKMSKMLGKSPKTMAAFYDNDDDEWAQLAIEATPRYGDNELTRGAHIGWYVKVYDSYVVHRLTCDGNGTERDKWNYIDYAEHNIPVPPISRLANRIDLDGRTIGEIEPVLPLLRRIDQDVFDRLINQRFGAWQVRYIAGMAKPTTDSDRRAQAIKLRVEDLLVSTDAKTKFGVLPGGDLKAQMEATDADLRLLSAIAQVPPHHLLGLSSNLQAEALAAAEAGLQRKSFEFKTNAGEFHEQMARLTALAEGDMATAASYDLQVRWKDTESRSLTQTADALGKLAVQLKVPMEMLWERIPGWTDTDVARAKELVENGAFEKLLNELMANEPQSGQQSTQEPVGGNNQ